MAERYRKVSVRMWADDKFPALSPLLPSGQALWLYLLTGPHTTPIPGLFSIGRAGLAEHLGWSAEDFDRCWEEIESAGMASADWRARVVYLPKAIHHNLPESANVVTSWRDTWPFIPECRLKWDAYRGLRSALERIHEGYAKAFVAACLEPTSKASPKASGKASPHGYPQPSPRACPNQEQEQEQEQEELPCPVKPDEVVRPEWSDEVPARSDLPPRLILEPPTPKPKRQDYPPTFDAFWSAYPRKDGKGGAFARWSAIVKAKEATPAELEASAKNYAAHMRAVAREPEKIKHGKTFLSATDRPWHDYLTGIPTTDAPKPYYDPYTKVGS